ncbi:hypothetical protein [Streptomyces sp. UG1]|uniref:hypothetical protein n=1 Tax=Streptomyces sp. UG1 TaxID=3417652 RepID=UPI003CFB105F
MAARGPDEDARQAAERYWKRAVQIATDLGVTSMISEFKGPGIIKYAGDLLTHVPLTDAFDHTASSRESGFDGALTACVFAWEEKGEKSSVFMQSGTDVDGVEPG